MYDLTAAAETGNVKSHFDHAEHPRSPNWYQTHFDKVRRVSLAPKKKKSSDNVSEKSLRDSSSASLSSVREESTMAIMVSRSFVVTDSERNSYIDHKMPAPAVTRR
jgi:hypothetical protein